METGEIIWVISGAISLIIRISIAITEKKWKWIFLIGWPLLVLFGPAGLLMVICEWYGNRPFKRVIRL